METAAGIRWSLSELAPSIGSSEWGQLVETVENRIRAFSDGVRGPAPSASRSWTPALEELEQIEALRNDVMGYLGCRRAEGALQEDVLAEQTRMQARFDDFEVARNALVSRLAGASEEELGPLAQKDNPQNARMRLAELRREAMGALPAADEIFSARAAAEGSRRWTGLARRLIASTTFDVVLPDRPPQTYHTAQRYHLFWDSDPAIRKAAYEGLNRAYEPKAWMIAECVNATAGFDQALAERRGRDLITDLLAEQRISLDTVETMQKAFLEGAGVLRRYLKIKARLLGLPSLGVQDRSAPLPAAGLSWPDVQAALDQVLDCFERYAPGLADHSRTVASSGWLETEMRAEGSGGFCQPFIGPRQTRVFASYGDSLMSVATLAHELGHSFHAYCNFDQRFWRQSAPSTLCETASILCEHFLRDTLASDESRAPAARLSALCSQADAAVNYLIRIPRDFDFELEFLRARAAGDVSSEQLCDLMRLQHRRWFGDGLSDDGEPLGWAYSHFLTDSTLRFYSFPYSFGYMLSRHIADRFIDEGPGFLSTYVAFLRAAGTTTTEAAVYETLGVDVTGAAFWRSGLERIAAQVDAVEKLAAEIDAA